jgi:putative heme-binding domain-containing protein
LTGLGSRFSKIHIVESILEPSRAVATSFQTTLLALADGRRLSGIQIAETEASVTLVDNEARKHTIARDDIEAIRKVPTSAMPDGLEKKLSEDEFVDLVSFLASLTQKRGL